MGDKTNCKIVQDLLPNYMEKLTDEKTNIYIEGHLRECEECRKVYDVMKMEVKQVQDEDKEKKIDILKKYNKRLKVLKNIVLIILFVFIFHVVRNMAILSEIKKYRSEYKKIDNYWVSYFAYSFGYDNEASSVMRSDIYQKQDKSLIEKKITRFENSETMTTTLRTYYNRDKYNMYVDAPNNYKSAELDRTGDYEGFFDNEMIDFRNPFDFLLASVCSSIKSEECNGKQCYRISGFPEYTNDMLVEILYVEKDTGLTIRSVSKIANSSYSAYDDIETIEKREHVIDYKYHFEEIMDSVFVEPDINEYEIRNND